LSPDIDLYKVTTPDAQGLWDVVRMVEKVGARDGEDENLKQISQTEKYALYRLLENDFTTYYPQGVAPTMDLIHDTTLSVSGSQPWIKDLVSAGLVEKINQEGLAFTSEQSIKVADFNVLPYALELDGDEGPEWLLKSTNDRLDYGAWLFIDQIGVDSYSLLPSDAVEMPNGSMGNEVELGHDLTRDGKEDAIFFVADYAWGSNFGFFQVFTWDGVRVSRILDLQKYIRATDFGDFQELSLEWKIADVNGDGREELQVKLPRSANFGCEWNEAGVYSWNGSEPKFHLSGVLPPDTPLCWAAQGLALGSSLTQEQKAAMLEKALNNLPASTSPELLALLRVHLAARYTILGKDAQSGRALEGIDRMATGTGLVQVIQDARQASDGSMLDLFDRLYQTALMVVDLPPDSPIIGNLSFSSSVGAYPYDTVINPPMLCPLSDLAEALIENAELPVGSAPLDTLEELGIPLGTTADVQLDDDPENEIAVVVPLSEPQIIVLDQGEQNWRAFRAARLMAPAGEIQFWAGDLYQDQSIELLVGATLRKPTPYNTFTTCWRSESGDVAQFVAIRSAEGEIGSFWSDELCQKIEDLEQFFEGNRFEFALVQGGPQGSNESLVEFNRRIYSFSLQELFALERRDFWHGLDGILDEILTNPGQVPPDAKTAAVLNWVSPTAPGGERIIQRMFYFTAFYYEKNGDNDKAATIYKQLIHNWPDSIWSWLAWARIVQLPGVS
jgi:hypothetical protein